MNREIKFRAWDGEQMQYANEQQCFMLFNDPLSIGWGLYDRHDKRRILSGQDAPPLMQFTGLRDKNGKDIYEGDIVKMFPSGILGVVEWNDILAFHEIITKEPIRGQEQYSATIYSAQNEEHWNMRREVIGNIYEHPELLKQPPKE